MDRYASIAAVALLLVLTTAAAAAADLPRLAPQGLVQRIALGSCLDEEKTPPDWQAILDRRPDVFLMLGDNVYADTVGGRYVGPDLEAMDAAYATLAAQAGFRRLRAAVPLLAVWDDHDYGLDDGGALHPRKAEVKQRFADFFDVPADDPMRLREGTYRAVVLGPAGRRVQIILLDTRWFRSPLKPSDRPGAQGRQRYLPDDDPAKTLLGEAQWQWLEEQLREPAELRFIVSSIQVLAEGHGWERWRNLPRELQRLYALIERTAANGVVLLSGDRHRAAVFRNATEAAYPLYELTASSLTSGVAPRTPEIDPQRLGGGMYSGENFGFIEIDWERRVLHLDVLTLPGAHRVRGVTVSMAELQR